MRALAGPTCALAGQGRAPGLPPPRRVLLTNDDGPQSPFFAPWARCVAEALRWPSVCCLPAAQQSFVSKALGQHSMALRRKRAAYYELEGSPAACVNIALHSPELFPEGDCDLVLSGPNVGHNLGRGSILSSGTVGAAMEGALAGRRAIAISYPFVRGWNKWTEADIEAAVQDTAAVVQQLWGAWDPAAALYNVNVPLDFRDGAGQRPRPRVLATSIAAASYTSLYRREEGEGDDATYAWAPQNLRVFEAEAEPGTDVAAVKEGNISVSALLAGFGAAVLAQKGLS